MPERMPKEYLGGAVYMADDGYHMVLTTGDGIRDTNKICIEPIHFELLERYIKRFKKSRE